MGEANLEHAVRTRKASLFEAKPLIPLTPEHRTVLYYMTERHLEIVLYVGKALSNAEIAAVMFVEPSTVASHLKDIMNRLDINSRIELAVIAAKAGLV